MKLPYSLSYDFLSKFIYDFVSFAGLDINLLYLLLNRNEILLFI